MRGIKLTNLVQWAVPKLLTTRFQSVHTSDNNMSPHIKEILIQPHFY